MLDFAYLYFSLLTWILCAMLFACASVLALAFARARTWPDRLSFAGMWCFCFAAPIFVMLTYL